MLKTRAPKKSPAALLPPPARRLTRTNNVSVKSSWWLSPANMIMFFVLPLYVLLYSFPKFSFYDLIDIKVPVYFDETMFVYGLIPLIGLYFGCLVPLQNRHEKPISARELHLMLDITAALALIGYFYMYQNLIFHPALLVEIFSADTGSPVYAIKASVASGTAGINSFAQVGLIYCAVYWSAMFSDMDKPSVRHHCLMALLFLLLAFRAILIAERLALIEFMAPAALCFVRRRDKNAGPLERFVIGAFPIFAIILVLVLFGATEYLRSWQYYKDSGLSFPEFMVGRVLTYYFTALNNGALLLRTTVWPTFNMFQTFNWVYKLPGVGEAIIALAGPKLDQTVTMLENFGDPEFNNPSGVFPILSDYGLIGGLIFSIFLGIWLSYCYRNFIRNSGAWSSFYFPCIYLTTIEMLRIFYLGTSKFVMQVLLLWVLATFVRILAGSDGKRGRRRVRPV